MDFEPEITEEIEHPLPRHTSADWDRADELRLGYERIWERRFAPRSGSMAFVLRVRNGSKSVYAGRFRMYTHRYLMKAQAECLATCIEHVMVEYEDVVRALPILLVQRSDGWTLEVGFFADIADEAIAVLIVVLESMNLSPEVRAEAV